MVPDIWDFSSLKDQQSFSSIIMSISAKDTLIKSLNNEDFLISLTDKIHDRLEMAYNTYGPSVWLGSLDDDLDYPRCDAFEELVDFFVYYAIGMARGRDMTKLIPDNDAKSRPRPRVDGTIEKTDET